ncbi:hypothetical protein JTE90_024769 [Oedothorax gibbosus]|uniref:Transposable element P transposase-like GTP-binding insertion domain-containing protein n=1 Tax=Oedothorax gibbosus TaxID=931172 RepID=A0AAV6UA65_9ARAC|nr:hypothetical protein JTE90_024769 [Oedothorax gibbosus]
MWREFGVGSTEDQLVNEVIHPCNDKRMLGFVSDVPHLFKCMRNRLLKSQIFKMGDSQVLFSHFKELHRIDSCLDAVGMRVHPKLSDAHIYPNNFQKMKVSLMTDLFSVKTIGALKFYSCKEGLEETSGTRDFLETIVNIYKVLLNKNPLDGLKPESQQQQVYDLARPPRTGNCPVGNDRLEVLTTLEAILKSKPSNAADEIDSTLEEWL